MKRYVLQMKKERRANPARLEVRIHVGRPQVCPALAWLRRPALSSVPDEVESDTAHGTPIELCNYDIDL